MTSGTSYRDRLSKYCIGNGIDIVYGDYPILPSSITVDIEPPNVIIGNYPKNIKCDIREIRKIFGSKSLDYIYSSYLFKKFSIDEIYTVFWELIEIIKIGGRMILFLPNQQKYLEHCNYEKIKINEDSLCKINNFSLEKFKNIVMLDVVPYSYKWKLEIEYETSQVEEYFFEIVIKKVAVERKNV